MQVVEAVQEIWPASLPLFVRISASDWADDGWDIDQSAKLAALLKEKGVDLIDCSSGGNSPHIKIPVGPGYQVLFADRIKNEAKILTGAVGMITDARQAEDILAADKADLIVIARQSLRDPYFPLHAAKELGVEVPWPNQYLRAKQ